MDKEKQFERIYKETENFGRTQFVREIQMQINDNKKKDKEIERLHNEIKTLLKENGNKEKVIIKQNNIIDELKDDSRVLKEFSAWIVNRHEPDLFHKMEIVNKLSKLKEGDE